MTTTPYASICRPGASALRPLRPRNGSVIVVVFIGIIILSVIGGSVLGLGVSSHSLAMRNTARTSAQAVAESELEMMYYNWHSVMVASSSPAAAAAAMTDPATMQNRAADACARAADIFTAAVTPRQPFNSLHRAAGWTVRRSFGFNTTVTGQLPGDARKTGTLSYFTAGVIVTGSGANAGLEYRLGRRFVISNTSIFQFAIFYQGDLELAPGSNMDIGGPVSANGSIYAGANQYQRLTFYDTVKFGGTFNGSATGATDITLRNPLSPVPSNVRPLTRPVFNYNGNTTQSVARPALLQPMSSPSEQQNFLGGSDANAVLAESPALFSSVNDVYHAIVESSPAAAATPVTDNPVIAPLRMYNRAGLRITVTSSGTLQIQAADGTDYSSNFQLAQAIPTSAVRQPVYDQREAKTVGVTTIDMGALDTALDNLPALKAAFNGVLYVHDVQTADGVIRLVNASQLPDNPNGFTVATDNALYIQGDYNTVQTTSASLIADTVTALSAGWSDAASAAALGNRVATANLTITAGILTGNTATTGAANSGGAQNLLRLMENWSGRTITLTGSVGQLFNSKYFTAPFPQTMDTVYFIPSRRVMNFDSTLASRPPPGSPSILAFSRGELIGPTD